MRVIQYKDTDGELHVGQVQGDSILQVENFASLYDLALVAIKEGRKITEVIRENLGDVRLSYDEILESGRILSPVHHADPNRFWVTGTGLTHLGSAAARDKFHSEAAASDDDTDSMKIFKMGLKDGKPEAGQVGVQPEWFYKGNGNIVIPPEGAISLPSYAWDGGDEVEVCGFYIIAEDKTPVRIGYALGNEYSDHVMEKKNYLFLAHSKLRECSYGPEILLDGLPDSVVGASRIIREGAVHWEEEFLTGEANMTHTLQNLEHHHFKYDLFRQPGDLHCHFFGTATVSVSQGVRLQDGDRFEMQSETFGRPLRNKFSATKEQETLVKVRSL